MISFGIEWGMNLADHRSVSETKYCKSGIVKYVNSSYANDIDDKMSNTGYCFFLGRGIITWCSK